MPYRVPGPCTIQYGEDDLGTTKAGIIIRTNTSLVPIVVDQYGTEPATHIFGGKSCVVEVIGIEADKLNAANIWDGGVGSIVDVDDASTVGTLAGTTAQSLTITERDGETQWIADRAFPTDPQQLGLKSMQELQLPLMFLIMINSSGQLFSTVPTYIK